MSRIGFLCLLLVCLTLSGCMVTQQDLQMQRDLLEMKRRVGDAERAIKELQDDSAGGVRAHVDTLARNQADVCHLGHFEKLAQFGDVYCEPV